MTDIMNVVDTCKPICNDIDGMNSKIKKFARKRKLDKGNKYKIFRIEKDEKTGHENKVTMKKFYAADDSKAYEYLKEYRRIANPEFTYYYGDTECVVDYDKDGNEMRFDSLAESAKAWKKTETLGEKISMWLDVNICDKARNFFYERKKRRFWKKTQHGYEESYSLDMHIINDIIFNVPIIKTTCNGYPQMFSDKAILELHKNEKSFDLEKYYSEHHGNVEKNVEDLATAMYHAELDKLLLNAKLYVYYSAYGIIDDSNKDEVEFDKKWSKTLPYQPGRYKELNYKKLHTLQDKHWNSVFNWIKQYGRFLWT